MWLWFVLWLGLIPGAAQQLPMALVEGADPEELNPPPGRCCRGSEQAHVPDLSHFPLLLQWCVLCSVSWAELSKELEKGFSWSLQQQLWGSQSSPFPAAARSQSRALPWLCSAVSPRSPGCPPAATSPQSGHSLAPGQDLQPGQCPARGERAALRAPLLCYGNNRSRG